VADEEVPEMGISVGLSGPIMAVIDPFRGQLPNHSSMSSINPSSASLI
jgi:hypothetical protein